MMHFYVKEKELDNVRSHDLNYIFICILIKKVFQISQITCKNCNNYCVINQCCNNDIILMTWFFWKVHWIIGENSQFFNPSEYFPACKKHFCCYSLFTFLWMNISLCISCNLWLFFLGHCMLLKHQLFMYAQMLYC